MNKSTKISVIINLTSRHMESRFKFPWNLIIGKIVSDLYIVVSSFQRSIMLYPYLQKRCSWSVGTWYLVAEVSWFTCPYRDSNEAYNSIYYVAAYLPQHKCRSEYLVTTFGIVTWRYVYKSTYWHGLQCCHLHHYGTVSFTSSGDLYYHWQTFSIDDDTTTSIAITTMILPSPPYW